MKTISQKRWLSMKETAELMQISQRTISRYIKADILTAYRPTKGSSYRIDYLSIPAYLRANEEVSNGEK